MLGKESFLHPSAQRILIYLTRRRFPHFPFWLQVAFTLILPEFLFFEYLPWIKGCATDCNLVSFGVLCLSTGGTHRPLLGRRIQRNCREAPREIENSLYEEWVIVAGLAGM